MGPRSHAIDPNRSDSDDLDYGDAPSPRARPQGRSRKSKASPRKPAKRRRERYGDSDDDIEADSLEASEAEASFAESGEEHETREVNPRTGRGVRSAAKRPVKYEESEEEDIDPSQSDREPVKPPLTKIRLSRPAQRGHSDQKDDEQSLVVKLPVAVKMEGGRATRARRPNSARATREPTPSASGAAGARRSSRISHDDQAPLVALTDSGRHEVVTRAGTATPEPQSGRRPTRGSKGLKKPPSAIMEESMEDLNSTEQPAQVADDIIVQLERESQNQPPGTTTETVVDEDIRMEYVDEEEHVVPESQPDPNEENEDNDEDDEPIIRGGRSMRTRRKASSPPTSQPVASTSRRSLRNRKSGVEQSSDFEPDAEGEAEAEEEISDSDDFLKPPRGRSSNEGSALGRRSGRLTRKTVSTRSRSRRNASEDEADEDLDLDEVADEAAELDEDRRRNRRERKRATQPSEIAYERSTLRSRAKKPDYRIFRPENINAFEEDDAPGIPTATPQRNRRGGGGHTYRSLFSTYGPFGGAGGPAPVFGGPEGAGATGGVDSDSSDDEMVQKGGQAGVGGTVGMTPTSAFPKPYVPQALNADPVQGPGGGPPGLGKVKDRKALADADPLGVDTNVTFDGVGGLDNHINQLKEMVMLPLLYPEVFQRFHVTPPRGVLFHGPPGTGKTLLARALASSVSSQGRKVTFYMRKGADALSKWVGEAEKQLRLLFEEARKNQPSIIFFDEIDGLAPVRSSKQEQIHASIVATLLALMDGMDGRGQVIVIGATNRPDSVDPALRRPGRFDREFYFPLPDQIGRRKILDIHTKGWDPPLRLDFKDQLAELTRGYGGADLRALCTEAALNAVQGTYPQIYSSDKKLIIDPSTIKVLAKDFMISVNKIVPSSERSAASGAVPLKKDIIPLLRKPLQEITDYVNSTIPRKRKATALEEAMYDDRDDELGFQKETMQRDFEASRIFRPRLLIRGTEGMGQHYLGAALLSKFESLHVQNFDLPTLLKDPARSPEAAVVQLFEEVKRHKPSVIYIPNVHIWYETMADSVIKTFLGLLRGLPPTEPVLLLGVMETDPREGEMPESRKRMMRDMFGYSTKNIYDLKQPDEHARKEYFENLIELMRKPPSEFPEAQARKKRKLPELEVAPLPPPPKGPSKAELKAQRKKDHQTLNTLKLHIQQVMDQLKLKYKKFRNPIVDDAQIAYLLDDQDPEVLTTDLTEEQRQQQRLFRPYEVDYDAKGVPGIREVASNKFYYNLEIVIIEKRLSNGYYKRPKDFAADIKRLAKDAATFGDQDRLLKANEMFANVSVDMGNLETNFPALAAECEAVYEREQARATEQLVKEKEAQRQGEEVPTIVPNVPPAQQSKTTEENSGPIVLGQDIPGRHPLPPMTPKPFFGPSPSNLWSTTNGDSSHMTNGSLMHQPPSDESQMEIQVDFPGFQSQAHGAAPLFQFSQGQYAGATQPSTQPPRLLSQHSAHTQIPPGSQLENIHNSASTTTSGQKTSDRSNRSSDQSRAAFRAGDHADFSAILGGRGGSQLVETQEPSLQSQIQTQSQHAPSIPPLSRVTSRQEQHHHHQQPSRGPSISNMLNSPDADDEPHESQEAAAAIHHNSLSVNQSLSNVLVVDAQQLREAHQSLVAKSSGLSLEQLEQVHAELMSIVWNSRGEWNRTKVVVQVQEKFNETIEDIETCQNILNPSQDR